jgi:raffinose/stachyose/melibiose transport system substrate-binding protein
MSDKETEVPEDKSNPSRRTMLKVAAGTIAGLAVGVAAGYGGATLLGKGGSTGATTTTTGGTGSGTPIVVQQLAGQGAQYVQYAATLYNKQHPNVNVTVNAIPEATMNAAAISAVNANSADIIYDSTLPAFNAQIVDAGHALQLDNYVANYGWDKATLPTFTSYGNVNGHWYWVTVGTIYYGNIYWNVDWFTKNNVAPPTNHANLLAAAAALKKAGLKPMAHGYNTQPEWFMNTFSDWTMNALSVADYTKLWTSYGPKLKTSDFANRPIKFTDSVMMPMWQELATWRDQVLVDGVVQMTDATAVQLFSSQQAGMYAIGSWGAAALEQPVGTAFKYSFTPIANASPTAPNGGGPPRIVSFPLPFFILNTTKSPDICADFLNFMLSSAVQQYIFTQIGPFPIIPLGSAITTDPYLQLSLQNSASVNGLPSLAAAIATELHDEFETQIAAVLSNSATPAQAAQAIETLAIQVNQTGGSASTTATTS